MVLRGVRVVDLTRILSGPFCTALLADLGAEVIKIESPGEGDPIRAQGEMREGLSWYFANYNRSKRSLSLDLYRPEAREVLARLIARSDVLVENFRPGVLARMGFAPERLQTLRPGLICCSINGFGESGPYAARPAFDFIAQAMSGYMSLNGGPEDPPLRTGIPLSDLVAGLYAALGIVAALFRREREGTGERLSVSLLAGLVSFLSFHAADFLAAGKLPPRTGNDHPLVAPYGLFRSADGIVAIAPSHEAIYQKLLEALGLEALREHPDFLDNAARVRNRAAINRLIEARTVLQPSAHWIEVLNRAGVPCGPVYSLAELFDDPQVRSQALVVEAPWAGGEPAQVLGFPIKFAEAPCAPPRAVPACGADSATLLRELGYDAEQIETMRAERVI